MHSNDAKDAGCDAYAVEKRWKAGQEKNILRLRNISVLKPLT
jgi:hypothetical protein